MTFVSYAQNFEDVRLWRAFCHLDTGRYIDIGAQDPVHDSVSLGLYEHGWRGVHVEPTQAYADALRKARPDETVVQAAVSTLPGPIKFYDIPTTGLSTGIVDIADRHGGAGWECREILVPTITLAGLFDTCGPDLVHWLKIDVEGMEPDVIASWGSHPARPAVLIIEATAPGTQNKTHDAWYRMVLDRGYTDVAFDGLSRFFVHDDHPHLREMIAVPPNFFDDFHLPDFHFAAASLRVEKQRIVSTHEAESAAAHQHRLEIEAKLDETAHCLAAAEAGRADAASRASIAEHGLAEAAQRLDAVQGKYEELLREAGTAEGQLLVLREAHDRLLSERRDLEEAQHATIADLTAANEVNSRLQAAASLLEQHVRDAAALLANAPAPRRGLVAWFTPRSTRRAIADHARKAAQFEARARVLTESMQGGILLLPAGTTASSGRGSTHGIPEMVEHDEPITTVPRLLAPHDREFIHTAYVALLGRAPDREGERYYLGLLRSGSHKLSILRQLRLSPEGRTFIPGVAGLDRAIKRHRLATRPVLGPIVRLLTGADGDGPTHRQIRILANDLGRMASDQAILMRGMKELLARPATVVQVAPNAPTAPAIQTQSAPSLDPGPMPDTLDSAERRLLRGLRLFARAKGAPA